MSAVGKTGQVYPPELLSTSRSTLTDPVMGYDATSRCMTVSLFTLRPGEHHHVEYGEKFRQMAECVSSVHVMGRDLPCGGIQPVPVYRYKAELRELAPSQETEYRVVSQLSDEGKIVTEPYSCQAFGPNMHGCILLTSDFQLKSMTRAHIQMAYQTAVKVYGRMVAIFFGGDAVNVPDNVEQWFGTGLAEQPNDCSFFPSLQGRGYFEHNGVRFTGAKILQSTPILCALGNHDFMGRKMAPTLLEQFKDAFPREKAEGQYLQLYPNQDGPSREQWIEDHSYNANSYNWLFSLLENNPQSGDLPYYAVTVGDVRLIVLCATRVGRDWPHGIKGKFSERSEDFGDSTKYGYGEPIIGSLEKGSPQYQFLEQELQSANLQKLKTIVMFHNPVYTVGENQIPAFANPIQHIEKDETGHIKDIWYEYPKDQNILIRDVVPLFDKYRPKLVFTAHDHVWSRFQSEGVDYLESSNAGNSLGAIPEGGSNKKPVYSIPDADIGGLSFREPNGLYPELPTVAPLKDKNGIPFPFLASNNLTGFSFYDLDHSRTDSYRYDTKNGGDPVLFDRFPKRT